MIQISIGLFIAPDHLPFILKDHSIQSSFIKHVLKTTLWLSTLTRTDDLKCHCVPCLTFLMFNVMTRHHATSIVLIYDACYHRNWL